MVFIRKPHTITEHHVIVIYPVHLPEILDEDEDGDVLMNVNMADDERYKDNIENKKKKPTYNPYDDSQIDEFGMVLSQFLV